MPVPSRPMSGPDAAEEVALRFFGCMAHEELSTSHGIRCMGARAPIVSAAHPCDLLAAFLCSFASRAMEEERERCARVAIEMSPMVGHIEGVHSPEEPWPGCRLCIAAALRAREAEALAEALPCIRRGSTYPCACCKSAAAIRAQGKEV